MASIRMGGVEVIHRDVEEPLDLRRVEIDGQHAVGPGGGDEIRHQLGGDGDPRGVLAILPGVAHVGHDHAHPGR
jgi:hypothetical protein